MRVKKSIPTVLRIGDRDACVSYVGQTRTCARCGAPGHMSKDCNFVKCFKCLSLGHNASVCPNKVVCTVCGDEEHNFKVCPNSFANRANPTKGWANIAAAREVVV